MNSLGENFSEIAKIVFFVQVLAKEYVYIHVYAYVLKHVLPEGGDGHGN